MRGYRPFLVHLGVFLGSLRPFLFCTLVDLISRDSEKEDEQGATCLRAVKLIKSLGFIETSVEVQKSSFRSE